MDIVANFVLQVFGQLVLPILLPIFIFSILTGMRSEKLMSEVFSVLSAIAEMLLKWFFALLKLCFRLLGDLVSGKKQSGSYPKKPYPQSPKPGPDYPKKPYPQSPKPGPDYPKKPYPQSPKPGPGNSNEKPYQHGLKPDCEF